NQHCRQRLFDTRIKSAGLFPASFKIRHQRIDIHFRDGPAERPSRQVFDDSPSAVWVIFFRLRASEPSRFAFFRLRASEPSRFAFRLRASKPSRFAFRLRASKPSRFACFWLANKNAVAAESLREARRVEWAHDGGAVA